MKHGSLFSGIGGFDLAAQWAGWENMFQVEIDPFCRKVLKKNFPDVAKYEDIKKFDGEKYANTIDVISGGFPCQPFSSAGNQRGKEDDRYLWPEMLRVISEIRPTWVIGENVTGIINLGLEQVLTDMESEGYEVQPLIIPACAKNAPHRRDRVWIVANHISKRPYAAKPFTRIFQYEKWESITTNENKNASNPGNEGLQGSKRSRTYEKEKASHGSIAKCNNSWNEPWIEVAQRLCDVSHGVSDRLVRYSLTLPETNGIMGFILMLRRFHYATSKEARSREVLPILQQAFEEKTVQRCFGRLQEVFTTEDLRCPVHGKNDGEREKNKIGISERSVKIPEEELREMRNGQTYKHPSYRRGLDEQCTCEFDDIVFELSHEIALGEWKGTTKEAENFLYDMWQESRGERFLYEPLQALHEIWRSVTDQKIGAFRRHLDKRDQHGVQKLKSLGNAIVPQIVFQIMQAINKIEGK